MTNDEILAIGKHADAATPAPWAWRFPMGGTPELVSPPHGFCIVLDAVRHGFNRAMLRFARRSPSERGGLMFKADDFFDHPGRHVPDFQIPKNPDMAFIAAARTDVPALVNECLARGQRIAELEAKLAMKGNP